MNHAQQPTICTRPMSREKRLHREFVASSDSVNEVDVNIGLPDRGCRGRYCCSGRLWPTKHVQHLEIPQSCPIRKKLSPVMWFRTIFFRGSELVPEFPARPCSAIPPPRGSSQNPLRPMTRVTG